MAASITLAGESLIAQKQDAREVLDITRFVLALVPDLDPNSPVDRAAGMPPADQIVGSWPYTQKGYVNPNQVVYSLMLGSDVGDFDWNWIGLQTAEGVLFAVSHVPVQQKRRNIPPLQTGNNVTRNFLVSFDGAQALTAITIDAATWQHDFTEALRARQPLHENLTALAALTGSADRLPYFTGSGALSLAVLTTAARTLLAASTQAAQRSAMNLFTDASGVVTEGSGALSNIVSLLLQSATAPAARATLGADDAGNLTKGTIPAARVPTLNQSTTGNAGTATRLQTARTLTVGATGKAFDGGTALTWTLAEIGAQAAHANLAALAGLTGAADRMPYFTGAGALSLAVLTSAARTLLAASTQAAQRSAMNLFTDASGVVTEGSGALPNIVSLLLQSATAPAARATLGADDASNLTKGTIPAARVPTLNQSTTGNAGTATRLQTARTLTIGATGKSFNGAGNITWTLAEIGAQAAHANLTALAGLTGAADRIPYFTGAGALSLAVLTSAARTLLAASTQAAQRSAMNLFTDASGVVTVGSGALSNIVSLLLQSATAAAARATLGADDAGNLTKGTIPAARVPILNQSTTGNAGTATKLQTARKINNVNFDGLSDITISAEPSGKSICTAWVNFNGTGAVNILDSYNVSSITDNGTGQWTVNFASAMANSNYVVTTGFQDVAGTGSGRVHIEGPLSGAPTKKDIYGFKLRFGSQNTGAIDTSYIGAAVFGGK